MNFTWPVDENVDLAAHGLLVGLGGSKSYGTDHPLSDTDWRGVVVKPKDIVLSPFRNFDQKLWKGEGKTGRVSEIAGQAEADEEGVLYALDKFFQLASACNPNVVELLFLREQDYVYRHALANDLLEQREIFLSQRAARTFCGYAMHQLKRIKNHKRWISDPPAAPPTRAEYDLPPISEVDKAQYGAVEAVMRRNTEAFAPWLLDTKNSEKAGFWEGVANIVCLILEDEGTRWDPVSNHWQNIEREVHEIVGTKLGVDTDFQAWLKREKNYANAKSDWERYEAWKRNRNPARAELESRYGYDCKHAMHLVRLMRMAEELVATGAMHVYRPDREELISIRNGGWEYERLVEWAERAQDVVYDLVRNKNTPLPELPDQKKIENLYAYITEQFWGPRPLIIKW